MTFLKISIIVNFNEIINIVESIFLYIKSLLFAIFLLALFASFLLYTYLHDTIQISAMLLIVNQ